MEDKVLNILNGDSIADSFRDNGFKGDLYVWREMLCEGRSGVEVGSEEFFENRSNFLSKIYEVAPHEYEKGFKEPLNDLRTKLSSYSEINLWFEYDLFCHINLFAALAFLHNEGLSCPVYLICSGTIKGKDGLFGLAELSDKQLSDHFKARIKLNTSDIILAKKLWQCFAQGNALDFFRLTNSDSSFDYLKHIGLAYAKSFPCVTSGLNELEETVLHLIVNEEIPNHRRLIGKVLQNQGYYGYGDLQIERLIKAMRSCISFGEVLMKAPDASISEEERINWYFGGSCQNNFRYNPETESLIDWTRS